MAFEVVCVDVDSSSAYYGNGDCRCITNIGYEVGDLQFSATPERIHDKIEDDNKDFYVWHNGNKTDVIAAERSGTKYVRTEPNYTDDDNLLHQDSC